MFPRVVSPYVRLCAEKQNCCAVLAAGHRGAVICADASCSAIKTTAVNFFQNSPTQKNWCAGAAGVTNATPWREVFRAVGYAKCPSALPPRLRLSFVLFLLTRTLPGAKISQPSFSTFATSDTTYHSIDRLTSPIPKSLLCALVVRISSLNCFLASLSTIIFMRSNSYISLVLFSKSEE